MKKLKYILLVLLIGCSFAKTVYVPHGKAVKIRKTIKKAKVWVKTKDGKTVAGTVAIPEGWFCLPDPGKKKEAKNDGK